MIQEQSGFLAARDGIRLFWRSWAPDESKGSILLVHGTNEHMGRYLHVVEYFTGQGFAVYAFDQRGHGQSEGTRCYVDRFDQYLEDLHQFVQTVPAEPKPIMVGHSLGGLIAFRYALAYPDTIQALAISSPMFAVKAKPNPVVKALLPAITRFFPRLQIPANLPEQICRDPEVVRAYTEDPLVWKKVTPRWFAECTSAAEALHQGLCQSMRTPVLFLQAGDDLLVDAEVTRAIYELVPHGQKAFKLYPGKYHEIFNDPGREAVFGDIMAWIEQKAPAST